MGSVSSASNGTTSAVNFHSSAPANSSSAASASTSPSSQLALSENDFPPSPDIESDSAGADSLSAPIFNFHFKRDAYFRIYLLALAKSKNFTPRDQIERDTLQIYSNILSQPSHPPSTIGTQQSTPASSSHPFPSTAAAFLAGQRSLASQVNFLLSQSQRASESERAIVEEKYREREKEREKSMSIQAETIGKRLNVLKRPNVRTEEPCIQEKEIVRKCYENAQKKSTKDDGNGYGYGLSLLDCSTTVDTYHQCTHAAQQSWKEKPTDSR